jgi:hypothetical protein
MVRFFLTVDLEFTDQRPESAGPTSSLALQALPSDLRVTLSVPPLGSRFGAIGIAGQLIPTVHVFLFRAITAASV